MAGLPGAGKTTFIKNHFPDVECLDVDDIAMKLAGIENKHISQEDRERLRKFVGKATQEKKKLFAQNLDEGLPFVHSGLMANSKYALNMINQAKEKGFETAIIHVNVPVETAIAQNKKRVEGGERGIDLNVAEIKITKKAEYIADTINKTRDMVDYFIEVR